MLRRIVYVSSAIHPFGADELTDILRVSRRNNQVDALTGVLVHHQGNLMQALEGPPAAVGDTFSRIVADPRHRGVMTLLDESAEARAYESWAMGVLRPEQLSTRDAEGVRSLFDATERGPERAHRLLHTFRALARA